jgi:hypothetical protein
MARSSPHDAARSYFSAWIAVSWHKLEMRSGERLPSESIAPYPAMAFPPSLHCLTRLPRGTS